MTEISHGEWMDLASEEYRRLLELLRSLEPSDWQRQTDCPAWDVRAMVAHLCGAAAGNARLREAARQAFVGRRRFPRPMLVDSINEVQVRDRADRTPAELLIELQEEGRRGVGARRRIPAAIRALRFPMGPPLGTRSLGYLTDRIYTRDTWMHRIDISRAVDRPLTLTSEHDGVLVSDLVDEWAATHGQPFSLNLSGPSGLLRSEGAGGPEISLDAIEFARTLAGRIPASGLLAVAVPF